MKRTLKPMLGIEDKGFSTFQDAIDFCKKRPHISRAWIAQRDNFHVFVGAIEHHSQFYHIVADYQLEPSVTMRTDGEM